MSSFPDIRMDDQWILSKRGKKNPVDPYKPYGYFIEKERTISGSVGDVSTILLTNSECPFHCLMCDLWKNTLNEPTPEGAIPAQIEFALSKLPPAKHLKLYNSGSFFDKRAIPVIDYKEVGKLIDQFETVLVESHPAFINENCLYFRDLIKPDLQVAIGLETVHSDVMEKLNKRMTKENFCRSVKFLNSNKIFTRAFILLRPPFLSEREGLIWAKKSIAFAFDAGIDSCVVIPVRSGNGAMDYLAECSYFTQPDIKSLEDVIEYGISLNKGPVYADLWDIDQFSSCSKCLSYRKKRLNYMNLYQQIPARVECTCSL
jgi:radical SAM enzyme (TIGR01210 family)